MNISVNRNYIKNLSGIQIAGYIAYIGTNGNKDMAMDFLYEGHITNRMDKTRILGSFTDCEMETEQEMLVNIEDVRKILQNGGKKRYQALKDYIFILTQTDDRLHVAPITYNTFVKKGHMSRDTIKKRMNNLIYKLHVISSSTYKSRQNGYSYKVYAVREDANELRTYNPQYHIDYTKDVRDMNANERGIYFNTVAISATYTLNHPEKEHNNYVLKENGEVSYNKLNQIFKYFLRPTSEERQFAKEHRVTPRSRLEANHKGCFDKFKALPKNNYLYKLFYNWLTEREINLAICT